MYHMHMSVRMNNLELTLLALINSSSCDILNGVLTTKRKGKLKKAAMTCQRTICFTLSLWQEEPLQLNAQIL